jgi:hypothetical protein
VNASSYDRFSLPKKMPNRKVLGRVYSAITYRLDIT